MEMNVKKQGMIKDVTTWVLLLCLGNCKPKLSDMFQYILLHIFSINVIDAKKKKKKKAIEKTLGSFLIITQFNNSFEKLTYVRKVFGK
jgi:D-Tyr-tRNAtyr deacylase